MMTRIMTTKIPTIPYGMFHLLLCLALPRSLKSRHTLDEGEAKDVTLRPGGPIARLSYDRLSPGTTLRRFVLRDVLERIFRQGSGRPHLREPVNDHVPELREGPALGDDLLVGQYSHSEILTTTLSASSGVGGTLSFISLSSEPPQPDRSAPRTSTEPICTRSAASVSRPTAILRATITTPCIRASTFRLSKTGEKIS